MSENSLEVRSSDELVEALLQADNIIMKKYMSAITEYAVKPIESVLELAEINARVRLNKIEKLVFEKGENNQDKLMNVYHAIALCGGSMINVIVSDGEKIDYYVGTKAADVNAIASCQKALDGTFASNFPGSKLRLQKKTDLKDCMENIFSMEYSDRNRAVSVVSGIPGLRNEKNQDGFTQGIDKVIDAMKGNKFAVITISDPIDKRQMLEIKENYQLLFSQLSPFANTTLSYSESDSNAIAETITNGITNTMGDSISNTVTNSTSSTSGQNKSRTVTANIFGNLMLGNPLSPGLGKGIGAGLSVGNTVGTSNSHTIQNGTSLGETLSSSVSDSISQGKTDTCTVTNGRTLQINMENRKVQDLLKRIEQQIERIEDAEELGLWNTATYCIADDYQTSRVLANSVSAICRGEKNTVETFQVGTWEDGVKRNEVTKYLKHFAHPVLKLCVMGNELEVNPSSLISGKELVIEAGLPQKSVPGIPVSEMVPFSRNIVSESEGSSREITLGKIYHMGQEENATVNLELESLSSHVLITGSTGTGKSNTVYQMLNELQAHGIHYLVVEPAKGEYKNVFGNSKKVHVFGTNSKYNELLKINPFSFPESIHVLEHVDRLIEIFNACWPMYAAMPAVLKDALLMAYENCGWNLEDSENILGLGVYPTFKDLQIALVSVINDSAYSEEVKGNYIGSLATRIKSLTNGLNGRIFCGNEISMQTLFDEDTIVDLSRIGSFETKSLIMGIIVMKLSEYRMDRNCGVMNQPLKHVTVLEEAHNLLKSSSRSATEDGRDIAGKSIEMISNSIAEMRSYGEGFIIVDQSPGAIDISAIRNTNTKIIMRLPEEFDRNQAGKSAALKENQIPELAKLPKGVAVIYQNNWLDPVLCKISKANILEEAYKYEKGANSVKLDKLPLLAMLMKNRLVEHIDYNLDDVETILRELNVSSKNKLLMKEAVEALRKNQTPEILKPASFETLSSIVVDVLGCENSLLRINQFSDNCDLLQQELNREVERNTINATKELKLAISQCIMRALVTKNQDQLDLYARWREFAVEQRKLV